MPRVRKVRQECLTYEMFLFCNVLKPSLMPKQIRLLPRGGISDFFLLKICIRTKST
jgi:hypothetical protein